MQCLRGGGINQCWLYQNAVVDSIDKTFWKYFIKTPWFDIEFIPKYNNGFQQLLDNKIYEVRGILKTFYSRRHRIFLISEKQILENVKFSLFEEERDIIIFNKDLDNFLNSKEAIDCIGKTLYFLKNIKRENRLLIILTNKNSFTGKDPGIWKIWSILRQNNYEENEDFIFGWRLLTNEECNIKIDFEYLIKNL